MKKVVSVLLILCLLGSLSAGCGTKDNAESGNSLSTQTSSNPSTDPTDNTNGLTPVGTYPISNEKITLRYLVNNYGTIADFKTNDFTKYMEEKTNIHLEFEEVPTGSLQEKISLLFASDDLPDAFLNCIGGEIDDTTFGVNEKMLIPLDDLIETNMVEFKKVLETRPDIKNVITSIDGKVYSLPWVSEGYFTTYPKKMWINQYWVDTLGMKMPTTTEEFYQLCKAFKEKNPKGIAITGCINSWHSDLETFFMNSFLYVPNMAPGTGEISHVVKDGKIDTPVNKPEYKEALAYLNKLYKEGLIYEGSFTQNVDQLKQLVTSKGEPVLCMAEGAHMNYINIAEYPELYRHYTSLAPLEGPEGIRYTPNFKYNDYLQMGFTITKACKNPEAAIRWADALYNMEVQFTEQFGPKGIAWDDPMPGDIGVNGKPALYRSIIQQTSSDTQNACWPMTGIVYKPKEWIQGGATDSNVDVYSADGLTKFLVEETKVKYEPYAPKDIDIAPVLKLLPEESQEIQTLTVELTNYIEESMVRFIVGDLNIDKDWDKYVKALNDMGLEKELAIKQKAYDRQFKN